MGVERGRVGCSVEVVKDVGAFGSAGGVAGVMLATARAARELSVAELAAGAGCSVELVSGIESGRVDPTLDTVSRIVRGVGFEVRAGTGHRPNPNYETVTVAEVERLREEYTNTSDFRKEYGLPPLGPPKGTQREWDGTDPAPPRLFCAGPDRMDGGGWAAILVTSAKFEQKMTSADIAESSEFTETQIDDIEEGRVLPSVSVVQKIFAAMGTHLTTRLETYDDHDDGLHLIAIADPERFEVGRRRRKASLAAAVVGD